MNKYAKLIFEHFEEILASIFIIITTSLVLVNVFLRYFLKTGLFWTEEVSTSCFVWSVFLGSAGAYRRGSHIGVDILVNKLPDFLRRLVKVCVCVVLLVTNVYLLYLSCVFVNLSYVKPTAVLGVSSAWISSSLIVSFGLMSIYSVRNLIFSLKHVVSGKEV